jgi:hypothetical protein
MEEARTTRRAPLLVALAGALLLAAVWATMALAGGGSTPAAKPAQAPAAPAQSSDDYSGFSGKAGDHDCPFEEGTSNDL